MTLDKIENQSGLGYCPQLAEDSEMEWRRALDEAILSTDEVAIWKIMDSQQLNAEAHEVLVDNISRLTFKSGRVDVYCELLMMPVIIPSHSGLTNDTKSWMAAREAIKTAFDGWFGKKMRVVVFEGVMPMDWITTWRPRVIRHHLQRMVPGTDRRTFENLGTGVELPDSAPRLGFILIGCQQTGTWPELPEHNSLMDKRLKDVVKFALQMAASVAEGADPADDPTFGLSIDAAPVVLTPERVQFAVTDGIALWLMKLNECTPILGWAVSQSLKAADVVKFTLHLDDPVVRLTQFTVRMHQIGLNGLNDITVSLAAIAPNLETPADMTAEQYLAMQIPCAVA